MLLSKISFLTIPFYALFIGATSLGSNLAFKTFVSANQEGVSLEYVENSGVCETTPGVQQVSGYLNVGTNMSMVRIVLQLSSNWLIPRF